MVEAMTFEVVTCFRCGIAFALEHTYHQGLYDGTAGRKEEDGDKRGGFYCPNGHRQHYGKNTEQCLRDALLKAKKTIEVLEAENERLTRDNIRLLGLIGTTKKPRKATRGKAKTEVVA